jgi:iron complex transport system substrate-binding protein
MYSSLWLNNVCLFSCLLLFSCGNGKQNSAARYSVHAEAQHQQYAKKFFIRHESDAVVLHLFGNRNNILDTTASFVLIRDTVRATGYPSHYRHIKIPCKKIAALSSIYASMFCELGKMDAIVAVDNMDYVINKSLRNKHSATPLKELAKGPQIDLEQTVALQPDIVFTYGMGHGEELTDKLLSTKIPIAVSVDHLEETPLARAEWIRFFAAFVDKEKEADSIFAQVKNNYLRLTGSVATAKEKPSVFSEVKFGDVWYMPGGKSYVAQLLSDAGANYLWSADERSGSLPLSFEQVYARAVNAEYWINLSMVNSKRELLGHDARYSQFKAFRSGNLYNNNLVTNEKGYSIYWETGMYHPDRILSDLIRIFHPEMTGLGNDLYYYRQIK